MYRPGSGISIVKALTVGTLLCVGIVWYHNATIVAGVLRASAPLRGVGHDSKYPVNNILSPEYAAEYCERYRLSPFPPERVPGRKIYDLLLINTELELLEVRLGQMAPYVDYFIVLESDLTFTNKKKPLYVRDNWDLFKPWHDKIILRTLDVDKIKFRGGTWDREAKSRNAVYEQVVPYLTGAQEPTMEDVLLVSDADEIPKPEVLRALRNCDFPARTTINSEYYLYSFQWLQGDKWEHPQATLYLGENTIMPQDLRKNAKEHYFYRGGWHCSSFFSSIKEAQTKLTSFSHKEFDKPQLKNQEEILRRTRMGFHPYRGTQQYELHRIENNPDVPDYIKENHKKFDFMLDRDPPNGNYRDYNAELGGAEETNEDKKEG